jgi:hypothetical protein
MDMGYQKISLSATSTISMTTRIFIFSEEKTLKSVLFQNILNFCNQLSELFSVQEESKFSIELVKKLSQGFHKLSFIDGMSVLNDKFLQENLKFSFSENEKIIFCFCLENLHNEYFREISKNILSIFKIFSFDVTLFKGILILCDHNMIQSNLENLNIFKTLLNGTLNSLLATEENKIGN